MADNKQQRGQQDRSRVSSGEAYEVEDLHQKYPGLSHQVVKEAVKNYGPDRKKIEAYLDSLNKK